MRAAHLVPIGNPQFQQYDDIDIRTCNTHIHDRSHSSLDRATSIPSDTVKLLL